MQMDYYQVFLWLIRFKQRNILGAIFFSNFLSFSAVLWRSGALGKIIYSTQQMLTFGVTEHTLSPNYVIHFSKQT
jgi:hypothetical protein